MIHLLLLRFLETYFRHRFLYLLPVVIMGIAAGVYLTLLEPMYVARGVVYVQKDTLLSALTAVQPEGFSWVTPAQATSDEIRELMQTDAFVRSVIQYTDLEAYMTEGPAVVGETIHGIRQAVWTAPLGNNQLLVSASSDNPELAAQLVDATIESYLQWRINTDVEDSLAAAGFLGQLIGTYEAELNEARTDLEDYMAMHPEPLRDARPVAEQLEIQRLQQAMDLAATRYANALDKHENAQLAMAQAESAVRHNYVLIDSPLVPSAPERSMRDLAVQGAIFGVVGVFMTAAAIIGSMLLDRTVRFPIDVGNALALPVVAVVPRIRPPSGRLQKRWKATASAVPDNDERLLNSDETLNRVPI